MTAVLIRAPRPAEAEPVRMSPVGAVAATAHFPTDIVEEWGVQSFPASDPPSNW
jgi:hypothetical protein